MTSRSASGVSGPYMRSIPERTIAPTSYANAGSYACTGGIVEASSRL